MAGGVSNPHLVTSITNLGGFGFLAVGYKTHKQVLAEIEKTQQLTDSPFGVNVFIPADITLNADNQTALQQYRTELLPLAKKLEVELPEISDLPTDGSDDYDNKVNVLLQNPVAVVSFTFGLPSCEVVQSLQKVNTIVVATVTNLEEAKEAEAVGVNALCLQGVQAGGHRATFNSHVSSSQLSCAELIALVKKETDLPLIATGGITQKSQVQDLLAQGASAVQIGTLFLCAQEASTNSTYRQALLSKQFNDTAITRAFTGREARGLNNKFIQQYSHLAPDLYPLVHYLAQPIRQKANQLNLPEFTNLWAGTGFEDCKELSAEEILKNLI